MFITTYNYSFKISTYLNIVRVLAKLRTCPLTIPIPRSSDAFSCNMWHKIKWVWMLKLSAINFRMLKLICYIKTYDKPRWSFSKCSGKNRDVYLNINSTSKCEYDVKEAIHIIGCRRHSCYIAATSDLYLLYVFSK